MDDKLNKWVPGTIEAIERASLMDVRLDVRIEGYAKEFNIKAQWPVFD